MSMIDDKSAGPPTTETRRRWLNRNVFAFGLTSFLSDFCHEMATAALPRFGGHHT